MNEALKSAELYDPDSGRFSPTGSLNVGRGKFGGRIQAVVLASGDVLIPGSPPDTSEIYDPGTGTWRMAASMTMSRLNYTATLLPSGQVLVAGGAGDRAAPASSEIYDPPANRWIAAGMLQTSRVTAAAAALVNGNVLVTGGGLGNMGEKSADVYEPPPLPPPDVAPDASARDTAADGSLGADRDGGSTPDSPAASADGPKAADPGGVPDAAAPAEGPRAGGGCGCRLGKRAPPSLLLVFPLLVSLLLACSRKRRAGR